MKIYISKFMLLFLMFSGSTYGAGWSATGETNDLRVHSGTNVFATLSSLTTDDNQESCGNTHNAQQFSFSIAETYSDHLLSMLLSAEMAGRQIQVYLTGECVGNRPEINGVKIRG